MSQLLGPDGSEIQLYAARKKGAQPPLGPAYGDWQDRIPIFGGAMPASAIFQFDLSRLTLADYRAMRNHSQVNASLMLLGFMMHQIDWHVDCEDEAIKTQLENNLREVWPQLIHGMCQAFWAGFSPMALEYQLNEDTGFVDLWRIKDLYPEDCDVHWKWVEGQPEQPGGIPPKFKEYDGIRQAGMPLIPPMNSLWYPFMMENGNYRGHKLLKAAFQPWYFSILVHLYANRYYERYGEPTPLGRADFSAEYTQDDGTTLTGKQVMDNIMVALRNRSAVTLPSDRDPTTKEYDYSLEYLESQQRGAEFGNYLDRLDEEISISLLQPLLLMKTKDAGSHSLGIQHAQTWLWIMNTVVGNLKFYIDSYIVDRLKVINFGEKAKKATWAPHPLGKENNIILNSIVTELIKAGRVKVDVQELGQSLGMKLEEIEQIATPPGMVDPLTGQALTPKQPGTNDLSPGKTAPNGTPATDRRIRTGKAATRAKSDQRNLAEPRSTGRQISHRLAGQINKAWRTETFGKEFAPDLGYRSRMVQAFEAEGWEDAEELTDQLFQRLEAWVANAAELGAEEFGGPSDFMAMFDRRLDSELEELVDAG